MGIEKFMEGQFSPMKTGKKVEDEKTGEKKPEMDMTPEEARKATAANAKDKAEKAKKSLEEAMGENTSAEDKQREIAEILKNLK